MRRWIVFGCGAVFLGAAAWHFGKPTAPPVPPAPAVVAVAPAEALKESPAKIAEVIDLARAYEPVPEAEDAPPGGVDPATFIQVPDAVEQIPPAVDIESSIRVFGYSVVASIAPENFEKLDVMPRQILTLQDCLIECNPPSGPFRSSRVAAQQLDVTPREVK